MDKAHPLTFLMVVRSLDVKKNLFRPPREGEELLGPEVPYLSEIGTLTYLANCTQSDIAYSVNLLQDKALPNSDALEWYQTHI